MSRFSREEVYQKIGEIVSSFTNLQCDKCAQAVMQWLELNGIESKIIQLKTKRRNDFFIVSNRYSPNESITDNGVHYGVEVLGLVFDNLSSQGLPRDQWKKDFYCRSCGFYLEELDAL